MLPPIATKSFDLNAFGVKLTPNYLQAGATIFLIFLLILAMARMRRLFIRWSFKGAAMGILIGFVLAIILEGFLLINGETVLTSLLGWNNPPAVVGSVFKAGRSELQKLICPAD